MPTVTFRATATGTGVRQDVSVGGSPHVIPTDAYPAFGGADSHPSPLSYALASLTSCNQVTAQVVAKELGVRVDAYAFDVAADFDPATMVGGATGADDTFSRVTVRAELTTTATPDEVAHLRAEVERRCPVSALFRRAGVPVDGEWVARAPEPVTA